MVGDIARKEKSAGQPGLRDLSAIGRKKGATSHNDHLGPRSGPNRLDKGLDGIFTQLVSVQTIDHADGVISRGAHWRKHCPVASRIDYGCVFGPGGNRIHCMAAHKHVMGDRWVPQNPVRGVDVFHYDRACSCGCLHNLFIPGICPEMEMYYVRGLFTKKLLKFLRGYRLGEVMEGKAVIVKRVRDIEAYHLLVIDVPETLIEINHEPGGTPCPDVSDHMDDPGFFGCPRKRPQEAVSRYGPCVIGEGADREAFFALLIGGQGECRGGLPVFPKPLPALGGQKRGIGRRRIGGCNSGGRPLHRGKRFLRPGSGTCQQEFMPVSDLIRLKEGPEPLKFLPDTVHCLHGLSVASIRPAGGRKKPVPVPHDPWKGYPGAGVFLMVKVLEGRFQKGRDLLPHIFIGRGKSQGEASSDPGNGLFRIIKESFKGKPRARHTAGERLGRDGVDHPQKKPLFQRKAVPELEGFGDLGRPAHWNDGAYLNPHILQGLAPQGKKAAHAGVLEGKKRAFLELFFQGQPYFSCKGPRGLCFPPLFLKRKDIVPRGAQRCQETLVNPVYTLVFEIAAGVFLRGRHDAPAQVKPHEAQYTCKGRGAASVHAHNHEASPHRKAPLITGPADDSSTDIFMNALIPLISGMASNPHALLGHNERQKSPPRLPPPSSGSNKGKGHFHINFKKFSRGGGESLNFKFLVFAPCNRQIVIGLLVKPALSRGIERK